MPTIKEIAAEANVSVATVSKVLNGKGGASKETIRKIKNIARKMEYTPNIIAKSLKNQKSNTIGIVTEDVTVFNTPEIVDGIDEYCENHNYHYILNNLRLNKRFGHNFYETELHHDIIDETINTMLSKQVEGIIYVGCHSREITYLPKNNKIPFVCAYCFSSEPEIPSVIFDDQKAAYDATGMLIEKGHTKIGVITGLSDSSHTIRRLKGYQEALYDHSVLYNPSYIETGDWERHSGYKLCEKLIEKGVSAIFSHNDVMACGIVDYCNEKHIAVGSELSIIGFDNRDISLVCRPKLSTISLPLFDIGQKATEIIIKVLEGGNVELNGQYMMECAVLDRESTASIKS